MCHFQFVFGAWVASVRHSVLCLLMGALWGWLWWCKWTRSSSSDNGFRRLRSPPLGGAMPSAVSPEQEDTLEHRETVDRTSLNDGLFPQHNASEQHWGTLLKPTHNMWLFQIFSAISVLRCSVSLPVPVTSWVCPLASCLTVARPHAVLRISEIQNKRVTCLLLYCATACLPTMIRETYSLLSC